MLTHKAIPQILEQVVHKWFDAKTVNPEAEGPSFTSSLGLEEPFLEGSQFFLAKRFQSWTFVEQVGNKS